MRSRVIRLQAPNGWIRWSDEGLPHPADGKIAKWPAHALKPTRSVPSWRPDARHDPASNGCRGPALQLRHPGLASGPPTTPAHRLADLGISPLAQITARPVEGCSSDDFRRPGLDTDGVIPQTLLRVGFYKGTACSR